LAAGVAVDARIVDVKLAFDIFGETTLDLSHGLCHPSGIHDIPRRPGLFGQSTRELTGARIQGIPRR
jgi:hypothetical protein